MRQSLDPRNHEQGAALIVGLVLMMVLTLLAVSTMRTSTLELAMAGNAQYHEQATQLAETGIRDAVSRIESETILPNPIEDWQASYSTSVLTSDGSSNLGQYEVTITFINTGPAPVGSSSVQTVANYYEIESTGRSSARNAKSTLRQGFYELAGTM